MIHPEGDHFYFRAKEADTPRELDKINDLLFSTFAMRFAAGRLNKHCPGLLNDNGSINLHTASRMLKDVDSAISFIQRMPVIAQDSRGTFTVRPYGETERAAMYRDVAKILGGKQDDFGIEEVEITDKVGLDRSKVSIFCHDINIPVASIKPRLQMLIQHNRGKDMRPWALKIRADVRNLKRASSQAEMRLLGLPVDNRINLDEAVDILKDSFPVDFPIGPTDEITGDKKIDGLFESKIIIESDLDNVRLGIPSDRFAQIATNIAQNAERAFLRRSWRRQTEPRQVEISVKTVQNGDFVEFEFRDNACGLPQRILRKGYMYGLSYQGGKGIGMAGVVECITSMGGQYSAVNILDKKGRISGCEQRILLPTLVTDNESMGPAE